MFEHKSLDGNAYRLLDASQAFLNQHILEHRDNAAGQDFAKTPRVQHSVIGELLVERYLPAETIGDIWPHDSVDSPWWEVVSHPPHGGIVHDFNKALGGLYNRELAPNHNVVAFAQNGEEVILKNYIYTVKRAADGAEFQAPTLTALRAQYFAQ